MIQKIIAFLTLLFFPVQSQLPVDDNFSYQELTIPHLRNAEFNSSLNQLEVYQERPNYRSYLTSYNSAGYKVNGLLTIPKSNEISKHPAIVFVHGYIPPTQYRTTERYNDYVDYFARNGFVVFKIDLRGHGNSEGEAGGAYYSSDYIEDTLNAYSALQNSDFVDKDKVYLWGHSMAGNVVFRSSVVNKNIPKVVLIAGAVYDYSDFAKYGIGDNSYRPPQANTRRSEYRRFLMEHYGSFDNDSWFWKQVNPINYLTDVNTKYLVLHATDDMVVNVNYSRNIDRILKSNDIYSKYIEYSTGGHNISGASFTKAMQETVDFLKN